MTPGSKYRHYKGGIYTIVCLARLEENPNKRVVIYTDKDGVNWSRPETNFFSQVTDNDGKRVDRFKLL